MKAQFGMKLGVITAAALALAACASSTPYAPSDGRFGYSEQRIEQDRYRVTFSGNLSTTRETVESFLLYRAAELTVEQGFDYFIMTEQDTDTQSTYRTRPVLFGSYTYGAGHHHGFPYYAYGFSWAHDDTTTESRRYEAIAYILMRAGEKPADDPNAYDARDVMTNLGPLVESSLPE
jgi:hypothetical protein